MGQNWPDYLWGFFLRRADLFWIPLDHGFPVPRGCPVTQTWFGQVWGGLRDWMGRWAVCSVAVAESTTCGSTYYLAAPHLWSGSHGSMDKEGKRICLATMPRGNLLGNGVRLLLPWFSWSSKSEVAQQYLLWPLPGWCQPTVTNNSPNSAMGAGGVPGPGGGRLAIAFETCYRLWCKPLQKTGTRSATARILARWRVPIPSKNSRISLALMLQGCVIQYFGSFIPTPC